MLSLAGIISRLNKKREEKEFRLLSFLSRDGRRKNVSRRRMKKGRLRRDHRVALSRSKLFLRPRDLRLRRDDYVGYTRLILVLFLDYAS